MLNTTQTYSLDDFVRNPEQYIAHIKEARIPVVLTVNNRAEVVLLDMETYEDLVERLHSLEETSTVRAIIR